MKKWNERPQADKFMLVVRVVASLLVVVFAALQLLSSPVDGYCPADPIRTGVEAASQCSDIRLVCGAVYFWLRYRCMVLLKSA